MLWTTQNTSIQYASNLVWVCCIEPTVAETKIATSLKPDLLFVGKDILFTLLLLVKLSGDVLALAAFVWSISILLIIHVSSEMRLLFEMNMFLLSKLMYLLCWSLQYIWCVYVILYTFLFRASHLLHLSHEGVFPCVWLYLPAGQDCLEMFFCACKQLIGLLRPLPNPRGPHLVQYLLR